MVMVPQLANASPTGRRASKRKAKEEVERRASKGRKIRCDSKESIEGDLLVISMEHADFVVIL